MLRPPKIHGWIQLNLWPKRVIVKLEVKCPWDGYENLPLNLKSGKLMTSSILVFSIPLYYVLNVNQKPQTESWLGSMSVCKFSQFPAVFSVPSHPFFLFFSTFAMSQEHAAILRYIYFIIEVLRFPQKTVNDRLVSKIKPK